MTPSAHLDLVREPDAVVARLVGEVDLSNAAELGSALEASVAASTRGVVLDLSTTAYLDSAAIRMIFDLERALRGRRRQLRLVVPAGTPVEKVLNLTRVLWTMPHDLTADQGLQRLRAEVELPQAPGGRPGDPRRPA